MKEQRVLVTGAGTGIGLGIAREFAARGAAVALHYSHSAQVAQQEAAEIVVRGGKAVALPADFTDLQQVQRLADEALAFLGEIDVLVNNAGITMNRPFEQTTPEQFDILYHVNVRAPFFLTQAIVPSMLRRKQGAVINISSIHAFAGYQEHAVYAGTRGAIVAFTRELAIELAPRGIRVNGIAPGAIHVENYHVAMPGFDPQSAGQAIPAGFIGNPADIAQLAVFLASDAARYIVGQTLIVDGGTTSWMPFGDGFRQPVPGQFGKGYVPGL